MTWNRFLGGGLCIIFIGLGLLQAGSSFMVAWDGTDYDASKSYLYLRGPLNVGGERGQNDPNHMTGRLLLAIAGYPVRTLADARARLADASAEENVEIELWDPLRDNIRKVKVSPKGVLETLWEVPPAVWVRTVFAGGPAEAAGLQRGDLILTLDGHELSAYREVDPLRRLWASFMGRGDPRNIAPLHADTFLHQRKPDDVLTVQILRNGRLDTKRLILTSQGSSYIFLFSIVVGLSGMILGIWWTLSRSIILAAFLSIIGYLQLLMLGRPGSYNTTSLLLELGLGLPVIAWVLLRLLPPFPIVAPWAILSRRRAPDAPRRPNPTSAAVWASSTVLLLFVLLPLKFTEAVPSIFAKRILDTGSASVLIFALLFWVLVFGLCYITQILFQILLPLGPEAHLNQPIREAFQDGSVPAVERILEKEKQIAYSYYGRRLRLVQQHFRSEPDAGALATLIDDLIDQDEEIATQAFLVLRWCEVALPLLGFLGTVLGIGWAVPQMSRVIRSGGQGSDVMQGLEVAFRDLGLAFDTTLVGLVGLLVVGVLHSFIARHIGMHLTSVRELLKGYVAALGPTSLVAQLAAFNVHTMMIAAELSQARAVMRHLIDNGQEPPWLEIRRVLNRPIIAFEDVSEVSRESRRRFLKRQGLDNWNFTSIASGSARDIGFAILRENKQKAQRILRFGISTQGGEILFECPTPLISAVASPSGNCLAALTPESEVVKLVFSEEGKTSTMMISQLPEARRRRLWGLELNGEECLLIVDQKEENCSVWCCRFRMNGPPVGIVNEEPWQGLYVHSPTGTLVALESSGGKRLIRYRLQTSSRPGSDGVLDAHLGENGRLHCVLSAAAKIFLISSQEILIIEEGADKSVIMVGNISQGTVETVAVPREWPARVAELHAGAGEWFAVVNDKDRELSMWRINRLGFLEPYKEDGLVRTFSVGGAMPSLGRFDVLTATLDGRFLLAPAGDEIATWKFPKSLLETTEGSRP
jgi:biopolymer transport protein ExbB/TolQ